MSPRAGSAHSAASDKASKASKASASPRHTGSTPIKTETQPSPAHHSNSAHREGSGGAGPAGGASGGVMEGVTQQSPRAVRPNHEPEGHGASMEGSHGVPDKIEEGIEEG